MTEEKIVESMFECPFSYEEDYSYSEYTRGSDTMCTLTDCNCQLGGCPLKEAGSITVIWKCEL